MSPFTTYVSRRMLAAVAAFALIALGLAYVSAHDGPPPGASGSADVSAQLIDPAALQAALDDPTASGAAVTDDPGGGRSKLRADLRAAFRLDGDARRDALAAVRQKALDGGYGGAVQHRAERRDVRHDLFVSLLPDNLQADLDHLKAAPADQREQLRAEIIDNAVAGDYGPDVQKAAERLRALHQG